MNRTQFTFYESFYKAISRIKKKVDRADAYDVICRYLLYGEAPNAQAKKIVGDLFTTLLPEMDKEIRLSAEGRRCAESKTWRDAVFSRDDYTCKICGARGTKINAHHISSYAFFPEKRYDTENGITLCVPCHKKWHKENGYGG